MKTCLYCGTEFQEKNKTHKFCSSKCKNKYRWRDTDAKKQREELRQRIINAYSSDKTTQDIAATFGVSLSTVYKVWRDAGLPKRMTPLQHQIMELRKRGLCCAEIADTLSKSCNEIKVIAKRIGMSFTDSEVQDSINYGKRKSVINQRGDWAFRHAKTVAFFQEYHPTWEYVDGILSSNGSMKIQHKPCGSVLEKSAITVRRRKNLECPVCKQIQREERERLQSLEKSAKRAEREQQFWAQDFEQIELSFKTCKWCGCLYLGKSRLYCSDYCKRKAVNTKCDKRIRRKYKNAKTIPLEALYRRDNGVCWICGGKCNYDDSTVDSNGNFIVGATYPSVDHVYPLSKGGKHSWENVKLAHHYCNTLKRDKVV